LALYVPAAGACTNAADQQVWTSKGKANYHADLDFCAKASWGDAAKATSCIKNREGYSEGCAACFGDAVHCGATTCISKCIFGETAACKQCVTDNCAPAAKTCSGIDDPELALVVV